MFHMLDSQTAARFARGLFAALCFSRVKMVSRVICDMHGPEPQGGVLCCDHIREAIRSSLPVAYDEFNVDVGGDGSMVFECMLCSQCQSKFNLPRTVAISEEDAANSERCPYVCPACKSCFSGWASHVKT
jgi:hypothetical protein